jgi:1,4-alpha-glucan branching enzyme
MVKKNAKKGKGSKKEGNFVGKNVDFSLNAPEAKEVFLAGDFNQWDTRSLPMKRDDQGIWKLKTQLVSGRYEYKFFVDGNWFEGSADIEQIFNPFGTCNFVLEV